MARVVSLTLFLISWLLLFSYAASDSAPSKDCRDVCTEKVIKAFNHTDVADFVYKIRPQIDKLANLVCYHLYPDVCPVETGTKGIKRKFDDTDDKTPSTKDGIHGQPLVPKPSNDAEIVNKDSDKGKKRKFPHTDGHQPLYPDVCPVETSTKVKINQFSHIDEFHVSYDARLVKTPNTKAIIETEKRSKDAQRAKNLKNLGPLNPGMMRLEEYGPYAPLKCSNYFNPKNWIRTKEDGKKVPNSKSPKSIKS